MVDKENAWGITDLSKTFGCLCHELFISEIVHLWFRVTGTLLFDTFQSKLFEIIRKTDFACYAGDNTLYVSGDNIDDVWN